MSCKLANLNNLTFPIFLSNPQTFLLNTVHLQSLSASFPQSVRSLFIILTSTAQNFDSTFQPPASTILQYSQYCIHSLGLLRDNICKTMNRNIVCKNLLCSVVRHLKQLGPPRVYCNILMKN
jgi:hypothetical protein